MQLTGKFNLFNKNKEIKKEGKVQTIKEFNTSIGKKLQDGTYDNAYIEVVFANKEKFSKEVQNNFKEDYMYTIDVTDGWLDFRKYQTKDGQTRVIWQLAIRDGKCTSSKKIEKRTEAKVQGVNEEDLPF